MQLLDLNSLHVGRDWEAFLKFRKRKLHGLETGILPLDKVLLGLTGLTIIQGAPKANKSTLALQTALHNAKKGTPVLILDRENGFGRMQERLICSYNGVSAVDVTVADEEVLSDWVRPVDALPVFISTSPTSPDQLREYVKQMYERFNRQMLLIVDSLQKMPALADNERLSIQAWLAELDQLKLDWEGNLVMIATSEKARGQDNYDKASLSAAKGAGGIEYTGELILDLRRTKDGITCEIVANRDGIQNYALDLKQVLADPRNIQSFTFKLEAA